MKPNDHEKLDALSKKISKVEKKISRISETVTQLRKNEIENLLEIQEPKLKSTFRLTIILLICGILIPSLLIVMKATFDLSEIWICVLAGITGSSVSALLSALQRKANGWEFVNGLKYPSDLPKDKFSLRMAPFFMVRPILGVVSGLIIFYGFTYLNIIESSNPSTQHSSLVFWCLLSGLFAKSLFERLKEVFDSVIGK